VRKGRISGAGAECGRRHGLEDQRGDGESQHSAKSVGVIRDSERLAQDDDGSWHGQWRQPNLDRSKQNRHAPCGRCVSRFTHTFNSMMRRTGHATRR
jgi:hypothetical protein